MTSSVDESPSSDEKSKEVSFRSFITWVVIISVIGILSVLYINISYREDFEYYFGVNLDQVLRLRFSLNDEERQVLQSIVDKKIQEYGTQYFETLDERRDLLKRAPPTVTLEAMNIIKEIKDLDDELEGKQANFKNALNVAEYFGFKIVDSSEPQTQR